MNYSFLRNFFLSLLAIALFACLTLSVVGTKSIHAMSVTTTDYPVAGGADPWGTAFDKNGNVWVAVPGCDPAPDCTAGPGKIEVFNPSTKTWIGNYQLPAGYSQAIFLAIDQSGNVWFPMFHTSELGMFNPITGIFTKWSVPTANSGPWDIAIDHNGKIWFTEHFVNKIGEFDPVTQTFTEVQTPAANSQPYGVTVDGSNNVWFTENNPSIALIGEYTSSGVLLEYKIRNTLPGGNLTPHLITTDPSGNIWWTEGWVGMIGKLTVSQALPGTNNGVTEYQYPNLCSSCGNHTSGISVDGNGVIWFDDSMQNLFGSFPSGATGSFSVYPIPTAGGHSHDGMNVDKSNIIWFDEEFANKLAQAVQGPNVSPTPTPTPPFVTVGAFISQDTFQRPNQTHWGSASDGNVWGADAASSSVFSISSNSALATNPGGILAGTLGASATDAQVLTTGSINSFNGGDYGVILRYTNGTNWYKAYIDGSSLIIRRNLNGNNIVLVSTPFAATAGTSYTIKFQTVGTWLLAKAWATNSAEPASWMLSTTDNTFSSGYAGLQVYGGSTVTYTSFSANMLISASPTPTPTGGVSPTPTPTTTPSPTPTPGAVIAQDTFQRLNQTYWGTASDGHIWGADANTNSVFSITNNTGRINSSTTIYNAVLGQSATNAQILLTGSMSVFSNTNLGGVLRWTNTNNWYKAYIDGSNLIIQKKVNGSTSVLKSVPFAASSATAYSIRFQIIGVTLSVKVWAANGSEPANWMATASDLSLSSGYCGIRSQVQNNGAIAKFQSFTATSL